MWMPYTTSSRITKILLQTNQATKTKPEWEYAPFRFTLSLIHFHPQSSTEPQSSPPAPHPKSPAQPADLRIIPLLPRASSRSRIIWHLLRMVFEVFFLRITDLSSLTSSSVSFMICFLGLAIGITAVSFIIPRNNNNYQKYLSKYQHVSTLVGM